MTASRYGMAELFLRDIGQGIRIIGNNSREEAKMLYWAVVFLVIAIIAAVLGFGTLAGLAATIVKILFVLFLIFFIVSLVTGRRGPVARGL
jgi:uncharacterized membrane protein YtjA (UPF0391 family)